ncbi:MAG: hypothetical protein HYY01_00965 [Chloroflexi bacterium]|nr:hypothetical protein [Chloroflexota bacterium]
MKYMKRKRTPALLRKVHLGKVALPVWTLGLAVMLVAAVAGQAVGPVLSGSIQGRAGVVVSQTIVLSGPPTISGASDAVGTMNDEGTAFTVAIETHVGQQQVVTLPLANASGKTANGILELNVPAAIDVEVNSAGGVDEAQFSRNTWLFTVTTSGGNLLVTIESKDDAAPGFYSISGRIVQVSG